MVLLLSVRLRAIGYALSVTTCMRARPCVPERRWVLTGVPRFRPLRFPLRCSPSPSVSLCLCGERSLLQSRERRSPQRHRDTEGDGEQPGARRASQFPSELRHRFLLFYLRIRLQPNVMSGATSWAFQPRVMKPAGAGWRINSDGVIRVPGEPGAGVMTASDSSSGRWTTISTEPIGRSARVARPMSSSSRPSFARRSAPGTVSRMRRVKGARVAGDQRLAEEEQHFPRLVDALRDRDWVEGDRVAVAVEELRVAVVQRGPRRGEVDLVRVDRRQRRTEDDLLADVVDSAREPTRGLRRAGTTGTAGLPQAGRARSPARSRASSWRPGSARGP